MAELVFRAKGVRAFDKDVIVGGSGCYENIEGEIVVVTQGDKDRLALRINNKEVYWLDADLVKMIFEFAVRAGQPEILPYPEGGYVLPTKEDMDKCAAELKELNK